MASKKTTIARLVPAMEVVCKDGTIVRVPMGQSENQIANFFMAAQIRDLIESMTEKYKSQETILTPKELRDLAGAGRDLAEFSATLYKEAEPVGQPQPQQVGEVTDIPDFDKLKPKNDEPIQGPEEAMEPVGAGSPEGVQ